MQERSEAERRAIMAMPQCCYLAKGAKRPSHTTNTIKFDRIPFDPSNSIKRFDLCPFDQKNSTCLQPPIQNLCNQDFEIVTCRVLSLNYPIIFICCYRPPSGNLQLFLEEFHGLLVKFSSEYILCCGDFNIHVNRICPASTDFEDILDEFGLVQSVELPTLKNDNTLDLVIGPQNIEICLVSVSTSDHNWLNFDCLKHLLENRERSVVKFRNWKNVNLVDSNEDCFYHLWSIEGFPLMEFLGNPPINK